MRGYGRDYDRGYGSQGRYNRRTIPRGYDLERGYLRGGFMGSAVGRTDQSGGVGFGWSGGGARWGGGGPWDAYGASEMGITFGNRGPRMPGMPPRIRTGGLPGPRRASIGPRGMRYDIGYGFGNDREWF